MANVFVTGCAGFIGSHLCERLVADGHGVTGIDSFDPFYPRPVKERNLEGLHASDLFTMVEGDIRDAPIELDGVDVLVHLAAKAGVRPSLEDPVAYASVNFSGTVRLLELARRAGVRRVVFGSSSSVYGDSTPAPYREDAVAAEPRSPYGATKRAAELICSTYVDLYGLRIAALRFFTVYGPRQRPDLAIHKFAALLAQGMPIPMFGDGSTERDYTYVDDIVEGVERAMAWTDEANSAFEVINLGGGRPVRLDRLITELSTRLGVTPSIERLEDQPGDVRRTEADPSKARDLLGYEASTPLGEGLDRFIEWFEVEHGH